MNIIEINNIKKNFYAREKGKRITVEAVRGISLSIERGEIFGFLGPNGAGKTTTQRMLATLLPIDEGTASIAGFDVKKNPQAVRKAIGYVGQNGGTEIYSTGMENIFLQGYLYGMKKNDIGNKARELIEMLELNEFINRLGKTYSGGQKRRLEIALGLIHEPQVLFLDEPTTGLDPHNRANMWEYIKKLKNNGVTIFLTTHYLDEADQLCDRLAIIDDGAVAAVGTPRELKKKICGTMKKPTLDDVFLKLTGRSLRD